MSLYAYEVCDACEADQFGYDIDGVLVSDFVFPSWFESFWSAGAHASISKTRFTHRSNYCPAGTSAYTTLNRDEDGPKSPQIEAPCVIRCVLTSVVAASGAEYHARHG